jgi:hypothetical protein
VGSIPAEVFLAAKRIVTERQERERKADDDRKAQEVKPAPNEYTNLYWQPDQVPIRCKFTLVKY